MINLLSKLFELKFMNQFFANYYYYYYLHKREI